MNGQELRVGLVGAGAIAQIVHLPLLKQIRGVRVEAICDLHDHKAHALADRLDVPYVFRSHEELLEGDAVDAVVICSPNHEHHRQAIDALEAGKHVLVERPLALDADTAGEVVDAAERADRTLMVAFNNRFRPDVQGLKSFVTSGELGEIFTIHGTWFTRKVRPKRKTWRHRREAGGGAFMDLGVQVLDLCMWMLDYPEVERVCAHLNRGEDMDVEDAAAVLIRLAAGTTISVQVTWSLLADRDRHHVRLLGTAGTASTQPLRVIKEDEQGMLDVTPQIAPARENAYTASYRHELQQFVAASLGATESRLPREQIELMRIVEMVYESASQGSEVQV